MMAAEKDTTRGNGSGWERFEFDKDAPLDEDGAEGKHVFFIQTSYETVKIQSNL